MKRIADPIAALVGEPGRLVFTAAERKTLEEAATVLERARSYVERESWEDLDLARGEHSCRDAAERYR